jgi:hypothetical protein
LGDAILDADFSIELGRDDAVLEMPWSAPEGEARYHDLRKEPAALEQLEEAVRFPELGEFLSRVNADGQAFQTVKCDVWMGTDIEEAEEVFGGRAKQGSYCDLVFRALEKRHSFAAHERFARDAVECLRQAREMRASAEIVVRRCYFHDGADSVEGFAITVFVVGYGEDLADARREWGAALGTVRDAIEQAAES